VRAAGAASPELSLPLRGLGDGGATAVAALVNGGGWGWGVNGHVGEPPVMGDGGATAVAALVTPPRPPPPAALTPDWHRASLTPSFGDGLLASGSPGLR
jgi:hypothetical protein